MKGAYLIALLISLGGMGVIDWRYRLAFFSEWRRTLMTLFLSIAVFVLWDLLGIKLNIFFVGTTEYLTGIRVAPEVPLEELFFLLLLTYTALILWRYAEVKWPRI